MTTYVCIIPIKKWSSMALSVQRVSFVNQLTDVRKKEHTLAHMYSQNWTEDPDFAKNDITLISDGMEENA